MSICILNKISALEAKSQNRVESAFNTKIGVFIKSFSYFCIIFILVLPFGELVKDTHIPGA